MLSTSILSSWVVESNESNLGNNTNVANALLVNVADTGNNNIYIIDVGRNKLTKRYVGVVVDAVTANITSLAVLAERFRGTGIVPPASAAQQYVVPV